MWHSKRNPQLGFAIAAGILAIFRIFIEGSAWDVDALVSPNFDDRLNVTPRPH
jgi:hypothetical protein